MKSSTNNKLWTPGEALGLVDPEYSRLPGEYLDRVGAIHRVRFSGRGDWQGSFQLLPRALGGFSQQLVNRNEDYDGWWSVDLTVSSWSKLRLKL